VPTPAVVAGAVYPAGLFYRADLVTEQIPEGRDLAEILFGGASDDADRMQAMEASGALIRSLERSGVHHRDVNAKNIVLSGSGGELSGYLVDLDRCRIRPDGVSAPTVPMRQRLERSLRKLERSTGRGLDGRAWDALDLGFGTVS
jgi:3-deoxy-D-manno-octulosonic acid kinase